MTWVMNVIDQNCSSWRTMTWAMNIIDQNHSGWRTTTWAMNIADKSPPSWRTHWGHWPIYPSDICWRYGDQPIKMHRSQFIQGINRPLAPSDYDLGNEHCRSKLLKLEEDCYILVDLTHSQHISRNVSFILLYKSIVFAYSHGKYSPHGYILKIWWLDICIYIFTNLLDIHICKNISTVNFHSPKSAQSWLWMGIKKIKCCCLPSISFSQAKVGKCEKDEDTEKPWHINTNACHAISEGTPGKFWAMFLFTVLAGHQVASLGLQWCMSRGWVQIAIERTQRECWYE